MLKSTALLEEHKKLGGRLIDFGGWELPVQYSGVIDEHLTCRNSVGLFDVSHMGEFHVEGQDAEGFLNYLVSNNVAKLANGQAQYTVMCMENGGIVDDLVIYKRSSQRFLVVVNASNTDKDFAHVLDVKQKYEKKNGKVLDLKVTNESTRYTQIAIQGREAVKILSELTSADLKSIKNYWFVENDMMDNIPAVIARTGYTGEDGFEVYVPWEKGPAVWRAFLEKGSPFGIKPCGLGARDTLRLEMKYPLYGNELSSETNPLEAGLSWVVKLDKGNFVGREALIKAKEAGLQRHLVGMRLLERGIARHGYPIYDASGAKLIGEVTSGTQSPCLKESIAIGYVRVDESKLGTKINVEIRGTKVPAEVIPTPFYKRPY